jgi:hypothetical protein
MPVALALLTIRSPAAERLAPSEYSPTWEDEAWTVPRLALKITCSFLQVILVWFVVDQDASIGSSIVTTARRFTVPSWTDRR